MSTTLESLAYGKKGVLEFLAGPSGSDVAEASTEMYKLFTGQRSKIGQKAAARLPFVGRVARAALREERPRRRRRRRTR